MKNALITQTELQQDRIEEGDAAVILKRDGSFRVVQCYAPGDVDPDQLTERQMQQGTALLAFSFMLHEQEMMDIVAGLASDSPILALGRKH